MSDGASTSVDLESLLTDALRPIEPPEELSGRVETTLSRVAEAAAIELSGWVEGLSDGELAALRDPRKWFRPVATVAAGGVAGAALVLIELRRRQRSRGHGLPDQIRSLLP
jgi:H+/Cl- antiporter ClcA